VIQRLVVVLPPGPVAVTVKAFPACATPGVPERVPVAASSASPGGGGGSMLQAVTSPVTDGTFGAIATPWV